MKVQYNVFANTRMLTREQWLERRRTGIGGSDAGAVMGVNPYRGPYAVWADKMGKGVEVEDNEAMRQGRDLEEYVAQRFSEKTGLRVRRNRGMMRSIEHPCMVADIDRQIIGKRAGLECKTCRDVQPKRYRNGEFPMEYYCQILHYLAVTGWDEWHLAVLVYGTDLLTYCIRADDVRDDIDALVAAEEAFWRDYVETGVQPVPDGLDSTTRALGSVWPQDNGEALDADDETERLLCDLVEMKKQKKALEKDIAAAENAIKATMGEAETLNGTAARATWKTGTQKRFDEKLLKAAYPDVDVSKVKKEVSSRRFTVKSDEEEEL